MSQRTLEYLEILAKVLFRCAMLGVVLLLSWLAIWMLLGPAIWAWQASLFNLPADVLQLVVYCAMGLFKLLIIILFFIPWAAIRFVLRNEV
jgi:hypothetical protein